MSFRISGESRRPTTDYFSSGRTILDAGAEPVEQRRSYSMFWQSDDALEQGPQPTMTMARSRPATTDPGSDPAAPAFAQGDWSATQRRRGLDMCVATAKHPFAFAEVLPG